MKERKLNIVYIVLQVILAVLAIYFLFAYGFDLNTPWAESNLDGLIGSGICLGFSILPYILRPLKIQFTKILEVYFLIAIILHFFMGRVFGVYHLKYYSFIVHLINSFLMGVVIYGMILRTQKKQGRLFMFIMVCASVVLIGAVWEIVEFFIDRWFDGNMQRTLDNVTRVPLLGKKAILDTMIDICMDVLGGVLAGLFAGVIKIKNKPLYIYFELKSAKYRPALLGEVGYFEEDKSKNKKE